MREGYFVRFFTHKNREHKGWQLSSWIIQQARELGIGGATLIVAREGYGLGGNFYSDCSYFGENPPEQVTMALTSAELAALLARFADDGLRVFYTKARVEFGITCEETHKPLQLVKG